MIVLLVPFTHSDAYHILSDRKLSPRSKRIADYWLSLWDGDDLPPRQAISPAAIKDLLPALIFFEVVPAHSVRVRMAGTDFGQLLKFELTGRDWLAVTPQHDRAERLAVFSAVAEGAIAVNRWTFPHYWLGETVCEKLLLPLKPLPAPTSFPFLALSTGLPRDRSWIVKPIFRSFRFHRF